MRTKEQIEADLNADYDAWFADFLGLAARVSPRPEDWVEHWYDGYTPKEAAEEALGGGNS